MVAGRRLSRSVAYVSIYGVAVVTSVQFPVAS
jgi:hypothetical protein